MNFKKLEEEIGKHLAVILKWPEIPQAIKDSLTITDWIQIRRITPPGNDIGYQALKKLEKLPANLKTLVIIYKEAIAYKDQQLASEIFKRIKSIVQ